MASGVAYQHTDQPKPTAKKEKKPVEFSLLRCCDDDMEEAKVHHLKWDSVIASGVLLLEEGDDELTIRKAVKEALRAKFSLLTSCT